MNLDEPDTRRQKAQLEAEREKIEKQFYWSRHDGTSAEDRQKLEQRWNEVRAQQLPFEKAEAEQKYKDAERKLAMAGKGDDLKQLKSDRDKFRKQYEVIKDKEWTYLHDRRDNWTFHGQQVRRGVWIAKAEGHVPDPRTTINWREDTKIGARREAAVRKQVAGGSGDDAGHLIKAEWGADPEGVNAGCVDPARPNDLEVRQRVNFGRQNLSMNRGPGWKAFEDATKQRHLQLSGENASLPESKRRHLFVQVEAVTAEKNFEGARERNRKFLVREGIDGDPKKWEYANLRVRQDGREVDFQLNDRLVEGNFSHKKQRQATKTQDLGPAK